MKLELQVVETSQTVVSAIISFHITKCWALMFTNWPRDIWTPRTFRWGQQININFQLYGNLFKYTLKINHEKPTENGPFLKVSGTFMPNSDSPRDIHHKHGHAASTRVKWSSRVVSNGSESHDLSYTYTIRKCLLAQVLSVPSIL